MTVYRLCVSRISPRLWSVLRAGLMCVVGGVAAMAPAPRLQAAENSAQTAGASAPAPIQPLPPQQEQKAKASVETPTLLPAQTYLIRGGTVMTGTGQRMTPGFVLVEAGKITAVGSGLGTPPSGATVIDASDRFITPGIIDSHSHLGVYPSPGTSAHNDGNEATDPNTAGVWAEHSFWPEDPGIERAVAGGVTTAAILPGSANLIGGRGVTLHLLPQRGSRAMRFEGAPEILKMACGENPKRVYRDQKRTPSTRMANIRSLRESLFKAQKYQNDWNKYLTRMADPTAQKAKKKDDKNKGKDEPQPPDRDTGLETLARMLAGDILVQWHCYTADDMIAALQVADEFGFQVRSFHHALEAYKIRDILTARNVAVSTWADWYGFKMEAYDGIPENLSLIHAQGGRAIVHSDSAIGIQQLHIEAAKALAAGNASGIPVSEDEALKWLTLNPAWALGIDTQVGSLEAGKRADLVIWTHNPFSFKARAEQVFIEGRAVYDMRQAAPPWSDFELGYRESVRPRLTEVKP